MPPFIRSCFSLPHRPPISHTPRLLVICTSRSPAAPSPHHPLHPSLISKQSRLYMEAYFDFDQSPPPSSSNFFLHFKRLFVPFRLFEKLLEPRRLAAIDVTLSTISLSPLGVPVRLGARVARETRSRASRVPLGIRFLFSARDEAVPASPSLPTVSRPALLYDRSYAPAALIALLLF